MQMCSGYFIKQNFVNTVTSAHATQESVHYETQLLDDKILLTWNNFYYYSKCSNLFFSLNTGWFISKLSTFQILGNHLFFYYYFNVHVAGMVIKSSANRVIHSKNFKYVMLNVSVW